MRLSSVCISRSSRFVLFHKSLHERSFATTPQHLSDLSNFAATTRKVCCIGRNYVDHIKELGNKAGKEPFFFLKPPTSILAPGQGSMLIPKGIEAHYEIELGIVIGQTIKDLKKTDKNKAMDSIGGYFLGIDMTARNMQEEMKKKGLPWTTAKGFDTWLPVSRFIPKARIPDPSDVVLKLTVNDVEKQNDSTKLMIYDVAAILAHISSIMTLQPGDVVITGTPKGVGQVVDGDVIKGSIYTSDGTEIEEGRIEVKCEDRTGGYVYSAA